jgi:hypothetical protein
VRRSSRRGGGGEGEGKGEVDKAASPVKRVKKDGGMGDGGKREQEVLREGVSDEESGLRFWRLSNGVRVSYKYTAFEAGQVGIKLVSRGGKMTECATFSESRSGDPATAAGKGSGGGGGGRG